MSTYRRGANFERRVKKYFEDLGYYVIRSAGSHGVFDLIAIKRGIVLGIQCKIDGKLTPKEKLAMLTASAKFGIKPLLAYREGRKLKIEYLFRGDNNHAK